MIKSMLMILFSAYYMTGQPLMPNIERVMVESNHKKLLCYDFVWRCISHDRGLLYDMAIHLDAPSPAKIKSQVYNRNQKTKGVQYALTKRGLGDVVSEDEVIAGDIVQYWYAQGDTFFGHCAIVEYVDRDNVYLVGSTVFDGVTAKFLGNQTSYDIIPRHDNHYLTYFVRLK